MSFYLSHNKAIFYLDATTRINYTDSARVTSHPTHDKKTSSDNYIIDNPKATVSGVITDVKVPSSLSKLPTLENIKGLKGLIYQKTPLNFKRLLGAEEEDIQRLLRKLPIPERMFERPSPGDLGRWRNGLPTSSGASTRRSSFFCAAR